MRRTRPNILLNLRHYSLFRNDRLVASIAPTKRHAQNIFETNITIMRQVIFFWLTFGWFFSGCVEEPINPILYGSISGVVLDAGSDTPIALVKISTSPATDVIETDDEGKFAIDSIATNGYTVRAEKDGYIVELETITVEDGQLAQVIFRMRPDTSGNLPPYEPYQPAPESNKDSVAPVGIVVSWRGDDPNANDDLAYDVLLFDETTASPYTVVSATSDTTATLPDLQFGKTYFWQVVAIDPSGAKTNGPVWVFSTLDYPDLRYLFVRNTGNGFDIFASNADGFTTKLTNNGASNWRPRMNAQRTKVAFLSNIGLETHLFVMNRDGSNVQQVTNIPVVGYNQNDLDFCWSPDGARLMYMNGNKLYTIQPDGSGLQLFATADPGLVFTECDWTASGGGQVAARVTGAAPYTTSILLYNMTGLNVGLVMGDGAGGAGGPMFSIDGSKIVYTKDVSGYESPDGRQLDSRLFLFDVASQNSIEVSGLKPDGTNDLDARFSPDGAFIIFTNTNNDGISVRNIQKIALATGIRSSIFENAQMPEWK